MALWLLALAIASFSLQAVDNAHLLAMLSLSQEYAKAGAEKTDLFQALAVVVGSARKWSHFSFLLAVGCWIFLLCSLLYRFRLVPRALAAFGAVGSLLQIAGVTLRGLLGYPPETRLAMPLAPAYVALALWLIVKGFDERHRPLEAQAHRGQVAGA
jgi:high-affinity Fe2+/Pb2+ permease